MFCRRGHGHRLRHDLHFYPASPLPLGHSGVHLCRKHRQRHNHRGRGRTGYAAATTKPKDATVWLNAGAGGIDTATSYTTNGYLATTGGEVRGIASNGDLAGYAYYSNGNYSPFYLGSGGTTATILPSLTTQAAAYGINNSKQVVGGDDAVGSAVNGGPSVPRQ